MSHIYYCEKFNNNEPQQLKYEEIFEGKLSNQITIFKKFEQNLEKREMLMEEEKMDLKPHVILRDPLSCIVMDKIYIYIFAWNQLNCILIL